ncbi:hypothetical protein VHEMI05247 [[Torrubiella] hemipterigena]|uniref:Probable guanine deaminase n=1 Tax=[Torrubiella] hemipterigena TaxID=1531966 RepID=A0A0A1TGJ6_9HYPO|nr:hypothetical protein VHEMI05247 [[Torrubiella] hemipterigena]
MAASPAKVYRGVVVHSKDQDNIDILDNALLVVNAEGRIAALEANVADADVPEALKRLGVEDAPLVQLQRGQFVMPGFVDTHNHAPQWLHRGQGQGLHILEWLDQVAFHHESKFQDPKHASRVYAAVVKGMLRQGVTTASYYGSRHGEATKILADTCLQNGQRALIGKCNMSRNAPDTYRDENPQESLDLTVDCIKYIKTIDPQGKLVRHVLTPRFAICCEEELLTGLGEIAKQHPEMAIQTHFNESEQEKNFTLSLFPDFNNEADLYEKFGLLNDRCILAHCTIMTPYESQRLQELNCGVAHCPTANMTVGGGFMASPIRDFLRRGMKVGLGTDSGGGYSSSMLNAMRHSMITSYARDFLDDRNGSAALSFEQVFHMATMGGANVVGWGEQVGDFTIGKQFDAMLVDVGAHRNGVNAPLEDDDTLRTMLEKFIMTGDDRNIVSVFVAGSKVSGH